MISTSRPLRVVLLPPSSVVLHLRETAVVDPPGVQTFATLTPLSPTAMRPLAPSSGLETSSSRPPLVPTREGGGSTSAAASAGPSNSASVVPLPLIPREIWYADVGLYQYVVPDVPLPAEALHFLADRSNDEVYRLSFLLVNSLICYI